MTDLEILEKIRAAGGSVRYGWSGWLGGVKGLRHDRVQKLAAAGLLEVVSEPVVRRTARSRGLASMVVTYRIRSLNVPSISAAPTAGLGARDIEADIARVSEEEGVDFNDELMLRMSGFTFGD